MKKYEKHPTKVNKSYSNKVLLEKVKILLKLSLEDNSESFILDFQNAYSFLNNLCNLINQRFLNMSSIYHNNKYKNLYQIGLKNTSIS